MATVNLKSISFPFRKGSLGFPQPQTGAGVVLEDVIALLLTTDGEIPMGKGIGTNIHEFVFETTGPLLGARIARDIRSVIQAKDPRMTVLAVETTEKRTRDGIRQDALISYEIGGEQGSLSIPLGDAS